MCCSGDAKGQCHIIASHCLGRVANVHQESSHELILMTFYLFRWISHHVLGLKAGGTYPLAILCKKKIKCTRKKRRWASPSPNELTLLAGKECLSVLDPCTVQGKVFWSVSGSCLSLWLTRTTIRSTHTRFSHGCHATFGSIQRGEKTLPSFPLFPDSAWSYILVEMLFRIQWFLKRFLFLNIADSWM